MLATPPHSIAVISKTSLHLRFGGVEDGRGSLGHAATLRFPSPLIEPDVRISRIRLSDWLHREAHERNHCRLATAHRARSMRLEAERLIA
jgi:hypothetical protein